MLHPAGLTLLLFPAVLWFTDAFIHGGAFRDYPGKRMRVVGQLGEDRGHGMCDDRNDCWCIACCPGSVLCFRLLPPAQASTTFMGCSTCIIKSHGLRC